MIPQLSAVFAALYLSAATVSAGFITFETPLKVDVTGNEFKYKMNSFRMSKKDEVRQLKVKERLWAGMLSDGGNGIQHYRVESSCMNARKSGACNVGNGAVGFNPAWSHSFFKAWGSRHFTASSHAVPEPSLWQLFLLSLLWIPFNRWKRKTDRKDSEARTKEKK